MQEKNINFAIYFLDRLKSALNIIKDNELAAYLGVRQNTISSWKSRNTIDYNLIIAKCENISFDWLITGNGEVFKQNENKKVEAPLTANSFAQTSQLEKDLENLKASLNSSQMMVGMQNKTIALLEKILRDKEMTIKDNETTIAELRKEIATHDKKNNKQTSYQKI